MTSPERISRELMAVRVAQELKEGMVVNLGIGMPTLVGNFIPLNGDVVLHAENGALGYGPFPSKDQEDLNLVNAGGQPVTLLPGASFVHHADAFAMVRGGHVDTVVLGGFQVSDTGDLANWTTEKNRLGSPGGAVDLAMAAGYVIVMMEHVTREGVSKMVDQCTYPLSGKGCVDLVITDLGVFELTNDGFFMTEIAYGWAPDEVRSLTAGRLTISQKLRRFLS